MGKRHYSVRSLKDFVGAVDKINEEWSNEEGEYIYPWFRGHVDHSYSLLPSIFRNKDLLDKEHSFRHDFKFKAHPFLDQSFYKPTNDLEWYFLMQHYSLPTRLLDWTEGSLIALHFAISYVTEDINPCVWMLNPFAFNKAFCGEDELIFEEYKINKYLPKNWSTRRLPKNPIAIQPQSNSKRIYSQKGCFMIFGSHKVDLSTRLNTEKYLAKIEIEIEPLEAIKDSLVISGITESMLFPELSGLAREINQYYR